MDCVHGEPGSGPICLVLGTSRRGRRERRRDTPEDVYNRKISSPHNTEDWQRSWMESTRVNDSW